MGGEQMKKKPTGFQKTAIGLLAGLILMSLLLIVPVAADAGEIVAWGRDNNGQCSGTPTEDGFIQFEAGFYHNLALAEDGEIVAWGRNEYGQCSDAPAGNGFKQVSGGNYFSLALKEDGSIVPWGGDGYGQCSDAPTGTGYTQVSAGGWHGLALTEDGRIVAWGYDSDGQCSDAPDGVGFIQVAAGGYHSMALASDGAVFTWGRDADGQCANTPADKGFTQINAGFHHNLALNADGTVVAWGADDSGQCSKIPTHNGFVQIAAGGYHDLALTDDGTIVTWGSDVNGQCTNTPTGNGFVQIAAGGQHSLALTGDDNGPVASITSDPSCSEGSEVCFDASGSTNTVAGTTYDWEFGDGASGSGVNVGHTYEQDGDYTVTLTVTNPDGQSNAMSKPISVVNVAPFIDSYSVPETACVGAPVEALVHFFDAGQDILTATWDWGDMTGEETRGPFTGSGELDESHVYTAPGEYMISLCITDDGGGSIEGGVYITITDESIPEPPDDPINTPEFPTLAVPSMLIVGLAGVVLMARRRE